jgi:capsular polysaccharide export protein
MIKGGLSQFESKRVLLLQGPIGPFFARLATDLKAAGAAVHKINFNGGDWLFYRKDAVNFKQPLDNWPAFFEAFIQKHKIDVVFLFGDCRPIHQAAHAIATKHNLDIGVFEEGYIRPDYITLERFGVNANSTISQSADFYANLPDAGKKKSHLIGKTFGFAAMWGMLYNTVTTIAKPYFWHYQHHKSLSIWQGLYWIRSFWRKWIFAIEQRQELQKLTQEHSKKYFLVPLQVHNDAQIHHHSDFFSVGAFISQVINSFAMHAPQDSILVIKHHPLDRGFNHYGNLIDVVCQEQTLKNRVRYVHDLHLPVLLNHAKGVVVINSTVGLSAIEHACPVITCGSAIYDIEGLTYQSGLDVFWHEAESFKIDRKLYSKFFNQLVDSSQINGNFYKRLAHIRYQSGICWPETEYQPEHIEQANYKLT